MTVPETNRDGRELGRRKLVERFSLTGHRALVIGGSAGIGFAIARGMAQAGADVAIVARDAGRLDAACRELAVYGGRVVPVRADVSDAAQHRRSSRARLGGWVISTSWSTTPRPSRPSARWRSALRRPGICSWTSTSRRT